MTTSTAPLIEIWGNLDHRFGANHGICEHVGYVGPFTTNQAEGALPSGTRIVKVNSGKLGGGAPVGVKGKLLGSAMDRVLGELLYFVEWDVLPGAAVAIVARKVCKDTP